MFNKMHYREAEIDDPEGTLAENFFILRLPREEANYIRNLIRTKPKKVKKNLYLKWSAPQSTAYVQVRRKTFAGQMIELPTLIDVNKSTNGVTMYKTGEIAQMLVTSEENTDKTLERMKDEVWPHGISRPMKNVRKIRFRKLMKNNEEVKEASDIQTEVSMLLRADNDAIRSEFEIIYEKSVDEVTADDLFGDLTDSSEGSVAPDIIEFN